MSGLFGSSGALGKVFAKARAGSKPLTGIDPAAPGVDRSQAPADTGRPGPRGRPGGSRMGANRGGLGARTVLSSNS